MRRFVLRKPKYGTLPSPVRLYRGGGVGIVLYTPDDTNIYLAFKLEFFCFNNKAEYEALL